MATAIKMPAPKPGKRDYCAEMRSLLDREADASSDPAPKVAERVVKKLRATDKDLLDGWLEANAQGFIRDAINHAGRSTRAHVRQTRGRSVFGEAAERYQAGDGDALDSWLDVRYVVEDGSRKKLSDMTADDLRFTADEYERTESESAMEKAFLRALAKKVGKKGTVSDHLTEDQIRSIRNSLG